MPRLDSPAQAHMSAPVYCVTHDATLEDARRRLDEWRISAVAVVESDRLVGVISRTDLLRVGRSEATEDQRGISLLLPDAPVTDAMTDTVVTVATSDPLHVAAQRMVEWSIHRVFVVDDKECLVGVLSTRDIMDAIANDRPTGLISEIMTSPIEAIRADQPIASALERMDEVGVSGLVVLEGGWPVGVFTQEEALAARNLPDGLSLDWALNPAILAVPDDTPLFRAASSAASMDARRLIVTKHGRALGVVTGLDFCRYLATA